MTGTVFLCSACTSYVGFLPWPSDFDRHLMWVGNQLPMEAHGHLSHVSAPCFEVDCVDIVFECVNIRPRHPLECTRTASLYYSHRQAAMMLGTGEKCIRGIRQRLSLHQL